MAAVTSALKSGAKALAEPLVCVGLKAVLDLPVGGLAAWVKSRFHDHSQALPKAIAAATVHAWQAVGLALAGDTLLGRITGLFRDGDLKAVQAQIRTFVADADTGLDGQPAGLRARACDELNRLQRAGRLSAEVELESADLTRFASTATVADDAHRAVRHVADDLAAEAPHLAQVLTLAPPGGGTPLLAAAFAFFLRRQIATNAELARELTQDQLRLLTRKQQAGFNNLELALGDKFDALEATLAGWFATTDAALDEILAELRRFRDANQVATKPESPLRVSVTNEAELQRLKRLRDRMREQPAELLNAGLQSLLGDDLAAAGQFADAVEAQAGAVKAAHESHDAPAEAEAAYKQFKAACELKRWDEALAALNRAIALDGKRFRPVPPLYDILAILGAGTFGVVLKCQDRSERDDDGNFVVVAVKTFRVADVDRAPEDVFAEASLLKKLSHSNVIGIHERSYVDPANRDRPFLAMEFFPGETLEDWLSRNGKLSLPDFGAVFGQIAAGLHAAHTLRRPIIHRDVKPANVMVRRANGAWVVKVIDFGLAVKPAIRTASLSVPHALRATRDKSVTGTIKFAAPEQMGERPYPVGPWSDVFAFGKTAMEALFGTTQPTPKHWRQLPESLSDLLERCVDEEFHTKNPTEGRFHGFAPVLAVLSSVSGGAASVTQPVPRVEEEGVAAAVGRAEEQTATVPASTSSAALGDESGLDTRDDPDTGEREDASASASHSDHLLKMSEDDEAEASRANAEESRAELPGTEPVIGTDAPAAVGDGTTPASSAAAMFSTTCPRCSRQVGVPLSKLGKKCFCPLCSKAMMLPTRVEDAATWPETQPKPAAPTAPNVTAVVPETPPPPDRQAGDRCDIMLPDGVKMSFAWCPPGTFLMGSPAIEMERSPAETQHAVTLTRGFWMGVCPVTHVQWQTVVDQVQRSYDEDIEEQSRTAISWDDAQEFCEAMKEITGCEVRLPTEAEWEYAARAGTTTPFYWGSELNGTQANCNGNYPYGTSTKGPKQDWLTTTVGSYSEEYPHPWGLCDVAGNVWEWCADWYGSYPDGAVVDPTGPESGSLRVSRGGCWDSPARSCRSASRNGGSPSRKSDKMGLRVVADAHVLPWGTSISTPKPGICRPSCGPARAVLPGPMGTWASTPEAVIGKDEALDSPLTSTPPSLSSGAETQPAALLLPGESPPFLRTQCPHCQKKLRFTPLQVGKKATCPKCGGVLTLWENNGSELIGQEVPLAIPVSSAATSRVRKAGDRHEITLPGGMTMAFAWCPPGTFLMGSPEPKGLNYDQQHEVRLTRGFWMGIHPVTQAQYRAVTGSNLSYFKGDTLPVERVSWDDAVAFCAVLKQKCGIDLRLPTEAEWEYAARGGTVTPFYWGDQLNGTQANCNGNSPYGPGTKGPYLQKTTPVGSYAAKFPHPWGLTDVIGNVWEWCADWHDFQFYARSPKDDPVGPERGWVRVFRGGSWNDFAGRCCVADRDRDYPDVRDFHLGFRLAAGPSGLEPQAVGGRAVVG